MTKKIKKTDYDKYYEELENIFEKVEKIFKKQFGTRCSSFEPLCVQCSFWQDFNNFKRETFKRSFG